MWYYFQSIISQIFYIDLENNNGYKCHITIIIRIHHHVIFKMCTTLQNDLILNYMELNMI